MGHGSPACTGSTQSRGGSLRCRAREAAQFADGRTSGERTAPRFLRASRRRPSPTRTATGTAALLDRAAERGLLSPYDYEARLRDLAEATSIEEMNAAS